MKSKVYVETTIISYLTARPSRDLITAAYQQITQDWWLDRRDSFDLFVSQFVIQEASGDEKAAERRLQVLHNIPLLPTSDESTALANTLVQQGLVPPRTFEDATHIAVATANGMDYLLT